LVEIWGGKSHGDGVVDLADFGGGDRERRGMEGEREISSLKVDFEFGR
jgi:hypothetical protein